MGKVQDTLLPAVPANLFLQRRAEGLHDVNGQEHAERLHTQQHRLDNQRSRHRRRQEVEVQGAYLLAGISLASGLSSSSPQ